MIRTAVLAAFALGAVAAPALAFESHSAPAPKVDAAFTDTRVFAGMLPGTTSEPFHFGAAEAKPLTEAQAAAPKKPTVIYELGAGKPAAQIDVTDPRDNPFLPQSERSSVRSADAAR